MRMASVCSRLRLFDWGLHFTKKLPILGGKSSNFANFFGNKLSWEASFFYAVCRYTFVIVFGIILGAFGEHFGVLGEDLEGVAKKSPKRCPKPPQMESKSTKIDQTSIKNQTKIWSSLWVMLVIDFWSIFSPLWHSKSIKNLSFFDSKTNNFCIWFSSKSYQLLATNLRSS